MSTILTQNGFENILYYLLELILIVLNISIKELIVKDEIVELFDTEWRHRFKVKTINKLNLYSNHSVNIFNHLALNTR